MGYFTPNTDLDGRTYTYEINIQETPNHELNALTVTKFSNHSEAKAIAHGLFNLPTKLVSLQESKFEMLQLDANMQACLMSNYLTYINIRGHEILQGTYLSTNPSNGKDCGGGTLFLEKVEAIVKVITPKNNSPKKVVEIKEQKQQTVIAKTTPIATPMATPNANANAKSTTVPAAPMLKPIAKTTIQANTIAAAAPADEEVTENKEVEEKKSTAFQVTPWVLVGRENKLVKKIITHNKTISIDLYDNGTIDNDTIIVYDNKQLIVNKKRLSYKAIHFDLNFSNTNIEHEIIIVAHNMGTVPPNTALLVYKDSLLRQELFITSTNKMNAKLVIVYEPPKDPPN